MPECRRILAADAYAGVEPGLARSLWTELLWIEGAEGNGSGDN